MWGAHWTIELEKRGVPGVFVVDRPFQADVQVTCKKEGMPDLRRIIAPHPCSDVPEEEARKLAAEIVDRLTSPLLEKERNPEKASSGATSRIAFKGTLEDIDRFFNRRQWTDGLPIMPPTEKAVEKMLEHSSHSRDCLVAEAFLPESLSVTVENVATVGVMAGCEPQYFPLLLAMVEAASSHRFASLVRSTTSSSFSTFVNGPFAREIGMNCGGNALGSGTGNKANATIGRFLRLALICLGDARTGVSDMSSIGNPSKYSFAFAENEERSPWEPFHVTAGFEPEDNVVTMMIGGWSGMGPFARMMADVELGLDSIAKAISHFELPNGAMVLMDPLVASKVAAAGYDKSKAEQRIRNAATRTLREFRNDYFYTPFIEPSLIGNGAYSDLVTWPQHYAELPDEEVVPVFPENAVRIVIVGGETNPMTQAWQFSRPSSVKIDRWM